MFTLSVGWREGCVEFFGGSRGVLLACFLLFDRQSVLMSSSACLRVRGRWGACVRVRVCVREGDGERACVCACAYNAVQIPINSISLASLRSEQRTRD